MKTITHIDRTKLAFGLQKILLDLAQEGKPARYPIAEFERLITRRGIPKSEAEKVTEAIIETGILRWELGSNCFVL